MSDNSLKTPLGSALNAFTRNKIADAMQLAGRSLPCSVVEVDGQIVTVKFELNSPFTLPQVTMPIFGAEYIRFPTQVGDRGFVVPADAYLGGISGLGGGVADLSQRANLSTLVFFPIGQKNFTAVDPNAVVVYGPNGVVLRNTASDTVFTLTPSGLDITTTGTITAEARSMTFTAISEITLNAPTIALNGAIVQTGGTLGGNVQMQGPLSVINAVTTGSTLTTVGDATIAGKSFLSHEHGGVTTGGGNTGVPI